MRAEGEEGLEDASDLRVNDRGNGAELFIEAAWVTDRGNAGIRGMLIPF